MEREIGATALRESPLRAACRVVVVNWNSGPRLQACVQSIPEPFEVVVVDNRSGDDSVAFLCGASGAESAPGAGKAEVEAGIPFQSEAAESTAKSRRERLEVRLGGAAGASRTVWLIRNRRNAGFAAAANAGAARCSREFLLFLNPDVSFSCDGSADAMLSLLSLQPKATAATGRLDTAPAAGGRARRSGRSSLIRPLPTLASALADVLFLDELWALVAPAESRESDLGVEKIEQAPGACLLIRRGIFEALGGFDPSFYPAWFEDVDLCRRLRDSGYEILYQPRSVFCHEGGYSVGCLGRAEFYRLFYGNMIRYFRKHHGFVSAAVLQLAVPLGLALRRLLDRARRA